jgi:CDP-4-dehydro-6-deoxyglucose reductase, E1
MKPIFPLATSSWDQAEYDALSRVIESDQFSMGSEVRAFEDQFAHQFGSKYAIMTNSGSSANLLIMAALRYTKNDKINIPEGAEIIVPAVSWSTTYYPLQQYGLKLKFVDIDLNTLNYDLAALSQAVTSQTRAIMVVNLLGNPNDFDVINNIIDGREIIMIEDNCESMGATFNGREAGTFGIAGSYSGFFSHHISTMEGGICVTDDEELYHVMLSIRAHGWTRNLPKFNKVTSEKSDDPFEESFRFVLPGYNLRPLEMSGALGREQLKKLPSLIQGRRSNGKLVQQKLGDHPRFMIQQEIGNSSWFGFSLVLRDPAAGSRLQLVKELVNAGFEVRPIVTGNFAKNEVMKYFDYTVHDELKNSDYIDAHGVFIGNHHYGIETAVDALATL